MLVKHTPELLILNELVQITGKNSTSVETAGIISYYINDEINSVTDILDAAGKLQASIAYDEFGIISNPDA